MRIATTVCALPRNDRRGNSIVGGGALRSKASPLGDAPRVPVHTRPQRRQSAGNGRLIIGTTD